MTTPAPLKPGDTIAIVAPARKVSEQQVTDAAKAFASWGLRVVYGPNLFSNDHSYLAATDAGRRSDLQQMLDDPSIKAIVSARGGYGTTRILESLDFSTLKRNPKWIVGFSDITSLHLKLFSLGIESIHGTMPILFSKTDSQSSIESLRQSLFGEPLSIEAVFNKYNRQGNATGRAIGGNLSLVADALGTPSDPDMNRAILVLEEIDEYVYKIDRLLMQLKRAGKFNELAGLVIGHMTDIKETELPFGERVEELVLNAIKGTTFPVAFNFPTGHENPNLAWRHGSTMTLSVTSRGSSLQPANVV